MPEMNRVPQNLDEMAPLFPCVGYDVCSWCPERDGRGPSTQVHIVIKLGEPGLPDLALRLKSKRACDNLIEALTHHRNDVWPTP